MTDLGSVVPVFGMLKYVSHSAVHTKGFVVSYLLTGDEMNKVMETEADQELALQGQRPALTFSIPELQYLLDKDITETDPMLYLAWRVHNVTTLSKQPQTCLRPLTTCTKSSPLMSSEWGPLFLLSSQWLVRYQL